MQDHPKYVALQVLSIGVKFYGNCALDVIRELLMSFPNLVTLEITVSSSFDPQCNSKLHMCIPIMNTVVTEFMSGCCTYSFCGL